MAASARIGDNTKIWINAQIRENAAIRNVHHLQGHLRRFRGLHGDRCELQNGVSVYHGVTLEHDVFVGPYAVFTNDRIPRAFNVDWQVTRTLATIAARTHPGRSSGYSDTSWPQS